MKKKKSKKKPHKKRMQVQANRAAELPTLQEALVHHQNGDTGAAREIYEAILDREPKHSDALHLLGVLYYQGGEVQKARELIESAIAIGEQAVYWGNLGNVLKSEGQSEAAMQAYRKAISLDPEFLQAQFNLAVVYMETEQFPEAEAAFRKSLEIDPNYLQAYNHLGNLYRHIGQGAKAIQCFQKTVEIDPGFAEGFNNLGNIFKDRGETEKAVGYYDKAAKVRPDFVQVYVNMGNTLVYDQRRLDQAAQAFEKVRQLQPENEWAIAGLAKVAMRQGDMDVAFRLLKPAVDAGSWNIDVAITFSEIAGKFDCRDQAIGIMEAMVESGRYQTDQVRHLHYNLGDAYDEAGDYDKAFYHYQEANRTRRIVFQPDEFEQRLTQLESIFHQGYGQRLSRAVNTSDLPVFIVGMPRSGTSLVEQIISSHSQCYGAGELPYIPRIIHTLGQRLQGVYPTCLSRMPRREVDVLAQGLLKHFRDFDREAARICDKMPQNFLHLGLISLLLSKARVIHCARDPRDTGLSIFFQNFSDGHPYAVDLRNIGIYYKGYRRIMAHWNEVLEMEMMTVQYEELIADHEAVSRRMLEFLGLSWEPQCLQFYRARRSVSTASFHQVRQPIYKKSLARWERYQKHISPFLEGIGEEIRETLKS